VHVKKEQALTGLCPVDRRHKGNEQLHKTAPSMFIIEGILQSFTNLINNYIIK
jgi:hypothetical protein